jgi:ficolin
MELHNGQKFSTRDQNNEIGVGSCAVNFHGAWWYKVCLNSNLNGEYGRDGVSGLRYNVWYHWKNDWEPLKGTIMMIRPNN